MNKQKRVGAFIVATVALTSLLLSTSASLAATDGRNNNAKTNPPPSKGTVPKANCGPRDRTESGLQGETTQWERTSGDSKGGYNCNLELVGQFQGEGAAAQGGLAWIGHCAYYSQVKTNLPLQQHPGVVVIDASDPAHPRATTYLDDPVMLDPHESMKQNERRKLLAAGEFNGPGFVVYDLSADCSRPVLRGSIQMAGSIGHMGGWAPDGMTYYLGQNNFAIGTPTYIVDVSDPSNLKQLPTWNPAGDGRPHDINLSADGTRAYVGQPGQFDKPITSRVYGPNGLIILDVSDYQFRRPNPQIRIVSKLFWNPSTAEQMLPFSSNGHQYIVSTDEDGGGAAGACARGASPFGYPQIIDITDETSPKIITELMLEVNDPAKCKQLLADPTLPTRADAYNAERCNVDRLSNPSMLACAFQQGGLRVFDIRDVYRPKEIAYYKPPAMRTAFTPGALTWKPGVDRTADRIAGKPRFVKVSANNKHGRELHIWFVSDSNGFQVVRFSDTFMRTKVGKVLQEHVFDDPA